MPHRLAIGWILAALLGLVPACATPQRATGVPSRLELADAALQNDDLAGAVAAWNDVLRTEPQNAKALAGLRRHREAVQARSRQWYLEGMRAYVKYDYRSAIACWQECLRYQPAHAKALSAIAQTRKKLERIRRIDALSHAAAEKTGEAPTKLSTAAEF